MTRFLVVKALLWSCTAFVCAPLLWAEEAPPCPVLSKEQCPALLLSERNAAGKTCLLVAHFKGKCVTREMILSSPHGFEVTQLGAASFLVAEEVSSRHNRVYAINLSSGVMKVLAAKADVSAGAAMPLARDSRLDCLRSLPERQKAMLVYVDYDSSDIELCELNLATFEVKTRHRVPKLLILGKERTGLQRLLLARIRLSPDFTQLAYCAPPEPISPRADCDLKLLDLETMTVRTLRQGIRVQLPAISSLSHNVPPLEWLSSEEILYQDIAPGRPDEVFAVKRDHLLRIVNRASGKMRDCLRQELRLGLDGGELRANPIAGQIEYQREWVVDVAKKKLLRRDHPYAFERLRNGRTRVLQDNQVLYSGGWWCTEHAISPSGRHLAYLLRKERETGPALERVFVRLADAAETIQVAEASGFWTKPIAWIESP
jgi:hypothetical protein